MRVGMETAKKTMTTPRRDEATYLGRRFHLIGIGGSGMRALAKMLLDRGAVVSGSDLAGGGAVERLAEAGATVYVGQRAENLPDRCDVVVHSAAIDEQNPELLAARTGGAEVLKYSQMLGRLMSERAGIAVAGTHGKSTTSGMVAYVLRQAGADPSFVVGATVPQLGGPSGVGAGRHFVAEACEYDRSFLNLSAQLAAILNVEEDHLDCYRDLAAIVESFRAFASRVAPDGVLVVNGDDREAVTAARDARCDVQTFGLGDGCTWRGEIVSEDRGCAHLAVTFGGEPFCELAVSLPGRHNAYNALAATALLHHAGLSAERIASLLPGYTGALRRMTLKGRPRGVTVLDDYAHHPTEVQATLRAIRDHYRPRRIVCVFQPHQHSRTRFLLKDFAASFAAADVVLVPDIYFVRDSVREKECVCAEDLVAQIRLHGGEATYLPSFEEIAGRLERQLREGDLVVTMGAGNVWNIADDIVRRLGTDS